MEVFGIFLNLDTLADLLKYLIIIIIIIIIIVGRTILEWTLKR